MKSIWLSMRLTVLLRACLALAAVVGFSTLVLQASGGESGVATLGEQLAKAQEANDNAAVVELCRRQLQAPGSNAVELSTTMFHAQVALADYERAGQTLDHLEKLAIPAAELADLRGDLALAADRPVEEAVTDWRTSLANHPADPAAILGKIADALDDDENWPAAAEAFRAFLRVHPVHAARQARLAVCLLNQGQTDAADREMLAASRIDAADETVKAVAPVFDRLRPPLAALHALGVRIDSANAQPATDINCVTPDARTGANTPAAARLDRALIFYRAGAYAASLADVEKVSELTSGHSVAARLLQGQCLWRLERGDEAVALRVTKIADAAWFDNQARCDRLRAADVPPASDADDRSLRQHAARAALLLEADQPVLALEDAEFAARLTGKSASSAAEAQIVLAAALLRTDRAAEALVAARHATELDDKNADAWALRGRLEQEEHADFPAAVESLTRALTLRDEPRWLRRREICLRSLGRLAEADRDARRLGPTDSAN